MNWFATFFAEKNLPNKRWVIKGPDGTDHLIDTEYVITLINRSTNSHEVQKLKSDLMRIDRRNGDVNAYLEHLARSYVLTHWKKL